MQTATQKGYKGVGMEGWTARWYARTRLNEIDDFRHEAEKVAEKLRPECDVLEVAPGPGYFSIELGKLGTFHITGLDISRTFIEIASQNARTAGVKIAFRLGNASAMPFPGESFDFVYCSAAFKNFSQPVEAMNDTSLSSLCTDRVGLRSKLCPLYPQKRTLIERVRMSALCQKRTFCAAAKLSLFDYLIGRREERQRKSGFQNRNVALSDLMLYVYAASIRRLP